MNFLNLHENDHRTAQTMSTFPLKNSAEKWWHMSRNSRQSRAVTTLRDMVPDRMKQSLLSPCYKQRKMQDADQCFEKPKMLILNDAGINNWKGKKNGKQFCL